MPSSVKSFHFRVVEALPFWCSLALPFLVAWAMVQGGFWLVILPPLTMALFGFLDRALGQNLDNNSVDTAEQDLFWYRLVTLIWTPLQFVTLFGALYYVTQTGALSIGEAILLFIGIGVMSGVVGINYSHELMHQRPAFERWLADILLAMVLYNHFRSEHLLVHHRYVGTPRDPVTARYNEHFHRFFWRVIRQSFRSALAAEAAMQQRAGRSAWDRRNPFWRYAALQLFMLGLALAIGGLFGLFLFVVQAFVAVGHLEITNYIEHYGLTRKHLGDGKYEHVQPHHSWNATPKASNWLLINLQRHSDHHYKPDRRFPLLQNYEEDEAPQLPYSYPIMSMLAMSPRLWRRVMNRRVQQWRAKFYPEIEDWKPYNKATNPMPR